MSKIFDKSKKTSSAYFFSSKAFVTFSIITVRVIVCGVFFPKAELLWIKKNLLGSKMNTAFCEKFFPKF